MSFNPSVGVGAAEVAAGKGKVVIDALKRLAGLNGSATIP